MHFWKLVGAIVVGNVITGLILWGLSLLFFASVFGSNLSSTVPNYAGMGNYSAADLNATQLNDAANEAVAEADNALEAANRAVQEAQKH